MGLSARKEDVIEAMEIFHRSAEKGSNAARLIIGVAYEVGVGDLLQDYEKALYWYRLAGVEGQQSAQLRLVDAYYSGWGRPFINRPEAEEWRHIVTEKPHPDSDLGEAECDVGFLLYNLCWKNDAYLEEGVKWFRRGAELGCALAQYNLACSYGDFEDEEENIEEVIKWYQCAAEQRHEDSYYWLAVAYQKIGEYKKAMEWYYRSAELEGGFGLIEIGEMYENGTGVGKDGVKAEQLYRLAAERGEELAGLHHLAELYDKGEVVPQDFTKTYAYYNLSGDFEGRNKLMEKMTVEQIAEGQRLSNTFAAAIKKKQFSYPKENLSELKGVVSEEKTPETTHAEYICVDFEQGTAEWLEWRDSGIGGSDAPTIMGENPWKDASLLLSEKLGDVEPFSGNAATRRGTQLEPEARELYEQIKNISVEPICLQSTKYPWMLASLDGMSSDRSTVVEIKCGEGVYQKTASTRKVPQYYMGQLQHILAVTGLPSIDFFCYLPSRDPICLTVERDDAYISRLIVAEEAFWRQVLEGRAGE